MRTNDILQPVFHYNKLQVLQQCSDFINESEGTPLVKSLPKKYNTVHKVKVRNKRKQTKFSQTFNSAFQNEHYNLRQRAIFTNGINSFVPDKDTLKESFYIFPINGYKYLYSKEVEQSDADYKQVFESILNQFGFDHGQEILTELLKFTYNSTNLREGIIHGSEIILYNIPYYYAVRTSNFPNYNQLLTSISSLY